MPVAKMEEVERRFGCPLIELWGMTELAGLGTTFPSNGPNKLGSIGVALPHVEARIADVDDASKTMPRGEVGELMIKGPIVMQGYYGNDEATARGDRARRVAAHRRPRQDGRGRRDLRRRPQEGHDQHGRVQGVPGRDRARRRRAPSVAMVAVGSQPDEMKGEIAKAYVVLMPGAEADADGIIALCREQLAAYKVPRAVQFVADLPKTSTGKVMRRELKTLDVDFVV